MDRRPTCPVFFYQGRWWYTLGDKWYSHVWMRVDMQVWRYRQARNVYVDYTQSGLWSDGSGEGHWVLVTRSRWFQRWVP